LVPIVVQKESKGFSCKSGVVEQHVRRCTTPLANLAVNVLKFHTSIAHCVINTNRNVEYIVMNNMFLKFQFIFVETILMQYPEERNNKCNEYEYK
uniref:Uncharacterized protein n=1 Tax=Romanomermis culicivorax TaxID=13658 RepID=A0A915K2F5_ROMCU